MGNLLYCLLAIVVLFVVLKLLGKSMKVIMTFVINAVVGAIVLWVLSLVLPSLFTLNLLNALLVGFLGIPGLIIVLILGLIL